MSAMSASISSFSDAQNKVKTLQEDPGNQVKLQLYALFKQVMSQFHSWLAIDLLNPCLKYSKHENGQNVCVNVFFCTIISNLGLFGYKTIVYFLGIMVSC